jgi:hypothetical protein
VTSNPTSGPFSLEHNEAVTWVVQLFVSDFRDAREPVAKDLVPVTGHLAIDMFRLLPSINQYVRDVSQSPPSPGYEPLLIERGESPLIARIKAYLLVHEAKRIASEARRLRSVVEAIRVLAKPGCARRQIAENIEILPAASKETRILHEVCCDANINLSALVRTLPLAAAEDENAIRRVLMIASSAAPHVRIPRGPKVTTPSAAHELFLEKHGRPGARAYSWSYLDEDFVDAATRATRLEFPGVPFDPRPGVRRLKARRRMAGVAA